MIAAIDPGYSNVGYAFGQRGELIACGTLYFKGRDRLKEIYEKVSSLFERYRPKRVLVEDFHVYREEIRGKHKTTLAIGIIFSCAYIYGAECELINHNAWKAKFKKCAEAYSPFLETEPWKTALSSGSEHSRDAVRMLIPEIFSLKAMIKKTDNSLKTARGTSFRAEGESLRLTTPPLQQKEGRGR